MNEKKLVDEIIEEAHKKDWECLYLPCKLIEFAVRKTKKECKKEKIKEFPELRKEMIQFVAGALKQQWKLHRACDVVDVMLVQFIDYFKKEHNRIREDVEKLKKDNYMKMRKGHYKHQKYSIIRKSLMDVLKVLDKEKGK